jgi:hypothetical protein
MVGVRTVASAVSLADGAWGIVLGAYLAGAYLQTDVSTGSAAVYYPIVIVGAILILDSMLCFLGFTSAFYLSAILAVAMLAFEPGGFGLNSLFISSILLAIVTVSLDAFAATRKKYVAEENHPLNLPVFG